MAKWCVEFNGSIEVEADSEEEAVKCAWDRLSDDGPEEHLMVDVEEEEEEEDDERGRV